MFVSIAVGLAFASPALAITSSDYADIAQHVYRGGASMELSGARCGTRCSDWWEREQAFVEPGMEQIERELIELRQRTGTMPIFNEHPETPIGSQPITSWVLGNDGNRKWFGVKTPPIATVQSPNGFLTTSRLMEVFPLDYPDSDWNPDIPTLGWVPLDQNGSSIAFGITDYTAGTAPQCVPETHDRPSNVAGWTWLAGPPRTSQNSYCGDAAHNTDRFHLESLYTLLEPRGSSGAPGAIEDYTGQPASQAAIPGWTNEANSWSDLPSLVQAEIERHTSDYAELLQWYGFASPNVMRPSDLYGATNPAAPNVNRSCAGDPVNCATGNFFETLTDFRVGGLGLGLTQERTYNAQEAAQATLPGPFGRGWSGSFRDKLKITGGGTTVDVVQWNGSTALFTATSGGSYKAQRWVQSTLTKNANGIYTYVEPDQTRYSFDSTGRLTAEADANGNTTTLTYTGANLTKVTDPSSRSVTFTYNADGTVASATDPAGHQVSYAYTSGDLTSVTDVGGGITRYAYDAKHRLTTVTDPRGNKVLTNGYDTSNRVTSQTDGLGRNTKWVYGSDEVTITNPAGGVTHEEFVNGVPTKVTKARGTSDEVTATLAYDSKLNLVKRTDPNGHVWLYGYDAAGNQTSATDPLNRTTTKTFDARRDVTSISRPSGHKSTMVYDSKGNLTSVQRTLTETGAQPTTKFTYDSLGQMITKTDPLNRTWTYGYDSRGNQTSTVSPLGRKTTSTYDVDGFQTTEVSPRGNETGAAAASFTTTTTRNAFELPTAVADGYAKRSTYAYDANQNRTDATDRDGRHRVTVFDAMNQATQVTRGDGSVWKTAYTPNGQMASQTDGLGKTTTYAYDAQQRLTTVTDPLNRSRSVGYDAVGNRTSVVDSQGRTTTIGYDAADEQTSLSFSSGNPGSISFAYNADGDRTRMIDQTGTTSYTYDSLGRLTSNTSGAGQKTGYGYDLADEVTSIAYPKALTALAVGGGGSQTQVATGTVARTYDSDGNLATVTDWLNNKTSLGYDSDADLKTVTRPSNANASYSYDNNDGLTSVADGGATTTLGRTADELLKSSNAGSAATNYGLDGGQRLTAAGSLVYKYDAGDNLTQTNSMSGSALTQSFDAANELASTKQGTTTTGTYTYDSDGRRVTSTPSSGASTSLAWDQAGQLAAYDGPDRTAASPSTTVSQQYTYNGDGLRQTKTSNNSLTNHAYDLSSGLPLMIADGPTAYITGPGGLPIEQIAQGNVVRYFNHDQLGSTTGLTTSTGASAQTYKYDAYGQLTSAKPTVVNPFRYAGQYTDPETGLQYLRARYYDPATGQMLSRDPLTAETRQPYAYAGNDPANQTDPTGLYGLGDLVNDVTGTVGQVDDVIKSGQSAQFLGNEVVGFTNSLAFGGSNAALGIDGDCLGLAGDIGGLLGALVPGRGALQAARTASEGGNLGRLAVRLANETGAIGKYGNLGRLADRADETLAQVIRSRGGGASQLRQLETGYGQLTLGRLSELANSGDREAVRAIKMAKQAGSQGKGGR